MITIITLNLYSFTMHLHMYPDNHDLLCSYVYINNLVYTHEPGKNDQLFQFNNFKNVANITH